MTVRELIISLLRFDMDMWVSVGHSEVVVSSIKIVEVERVLDHEEVVIACD